MNAYTIRAASVGALAALLETAQAGKPVQWVSYGAGILNFNASCVKFPEPEMVDGTPIQIVDPDSGLPVDFTPQEPTGQWICIVNTDSEDADLAAIAV